jgi:hypothetical protein
LLLCCGRANVDVGRSSSSPVRERKVGNFISDSTRRDIQSVIVVVAAVV